MTERGPLRHRRHLHQAERNTDRRANSQCDKNPAVADSDVLELAFDPELQQCAANGQHHAGLARKNSTACGRGRVHPAKRKNKESARNEVNQSNEALTAHELCHDFAGVPAAPVFGLGRLDLNIFNMRSVIRNPPTMLLVAAITARIPKMNDSVLSCRPTSTIAPTTAIASSALVMDISGVCSSGEMRLMTSNPMNPASMNTNKPSTSAVPILLHHNSRGCPILARFWQGWGF